MSTAANDALVLTDRDALVQLAHRLKGSAGTFGFDTVSALAGTLERAAKSGSEEIATPSAALDEALAALQSAALPNRSEDTPT